MFINLSINGLVLLSDCFTKIQQNGAEVKENCIYFLLYLYLKCI